MWDEREHTELDLDGCKKCGNGQTDTEKIRKERWDREGLNRIILNRMLEKEIYVIIISQPSPLKPEYC